MSIRDHPLGAACQRRLDRAQPDRAEAEDGDGRARLDPGLGDRVPAGAHHVAGEQRDVVGHPLRHTAQGEVRVRHQQQLRLGARQRAERRAVAEDPPVVALVEVAASAEEALAAGGAVGAEHAVALARRCGRRRRSATTVPTYSWPIMKPGSIATRPW